MKSLTAKLINDLGFYKSQFVHINNMKRESNKNSTGYKDNFNCLMLKAVIFDNLEENIA